MHDLNEREQHLKNKERAEAINVQDFAIFL